MVNELSYRFGKKMTFEGRIVYAFPTLKELSKCCRADLRFCRLGFRDKFLDDAIRKLSAKEIKLEKIAKMPYAKAMDELMKVKGIGKKVANCILLFGYNKYEAFPVDVWIERVIRKYFPGKDAKYFGKYAGYAQEYLYIYQRSL
jgi:N-glycosylase/DNA lyase